MTRQKKLSIILAGVSFVALSAAVNPVRAADRVISSPLDYLVIDSNVTGNLIVDADITGGFTEDKHYGIEVTDDAVIEGDLINNAIVTAYDTDSSNNADAYATGIIVHEGALIDGDLINNGTVEAYARAVSGQKNGSAEADAHGIAFEIGAEDAAADVYNEAGGLISAEAYATAAGLADAHAGGVYQGLEGETSAANVSNDGVISAYASAIADDRDKKSAEVTLLVNPKLSANASAFGIEQEVFAEDDASATVSNTDLISATALARATNDAKGGKKGVEAMALAAGVDQMVFSPEGDASANLTNALDAGIAAHADASAIDYYGSAMAMGAGAGVLQMVAAYDEGSAGVDNQGTISAEVNAKATAHDVMKKENGKGQGEAYAIGAGAGALQIVASKGDADADLTNSGLIDLAVDAWASATNALAAAIGIGAGQAAISGDGVATADLTNGGTIIAGVNADAYGERGALAIGAGVGALQIAAGYDEGVATLTNNNTIDVDVTAFASATGYFEDTYDERAVPSISDINISPVISGALAAAVGAGEVQVAAGGERAEATLTNKGMIDVDVMASAEAEGGFGAAFAIGFGAIQAAVSAGEATATLTNTGTINVFAQSRAEGEAVVAEAWVPGGVLQVAAAEEGDAIASLSNSSPDSIDVYAESVANGDIFASADAYVIGAAQIALSGGGDAYAEAFNTGRINARASSNATANGVALAEADAAGVDQLVASYDGVAYAFLSNTSEIAASATAVADGKVGEAEARAQGVNQYGFAEDVYLELANSGDILATASASAYGTMAGFASAEASGVVQASRSFDTMATLDNSGSISAVALATSAGGKVGAEAVSYGHLVQPAFSEREASMPTSGLLTELPENSITSQLPLESVELEIALPPIKPMEIPTLTLDVSNGESGSITAFSQAKSDDLAFALAAGAWYENFAAIDGTIDNAGWISGSAIASGTTGLANAFGVVQVSDGPNNTTLTNSGVILAYAEGPYAQATGIAIASGFEYPEPPEQDAMVAPSQVPPEVDDVTTVTNSGGAIFAGLVETGEGPVSLAAIENVNGEPIYRGNAINTRGFQTLEGEYGEAPNPVLIQLQGGVADSAGKEFAIENGLVSATVISGLSDYDSWGYIFGNIEITPDDVIDVTDGVTVFDGVINDPQTYNGELNIFDGGKLVMVQNDLEGASRGYVRELNIANDGTLVYELTPSTDAGDYSQLFAREANIDGKFVALYGAGFYGDSMVYEDIIDAEVLNTVDPVQGFAEVDDNSALLNTQAVVDENDNIDLNVQRVAFNEVDGLTRNQRAAGGAIEDVYDRINPDSDFGRLVGSMFTLDDGDYNRFMDQLTGAEHAQHLQSVLWSTRAINRIITERMECEGAYGAYTQTSSAKVGDNTVMPTADAPVASTGCFEPGTASVWMRGFGQWNALDGDQEAPGYDETQYGILFGGDYAFDENWFAGIAGGYFNSEGDFDNWGGREGATIDYDGLQLAAYGGYDNSIYYLRGVISYGNYDGESHRMIQFPGSSPIDPSGDPSSDTWSFYGETGYRFGITDSANLTPFAGLNLATASLDGFTEDDPQRTGAALEVHDADADSVASVLGVRLDADLAMGSGVFTPVVSVAWMHEFGDTVQKVDMSFAGAPSGADFTVESSEVARDSVLVDAGAKFAMDENFDFGLFYNGQFNEDYSSNAVTARIGYKF